MAASSRSRAWPVGRWQLHPTARRSCQTRVLPNRTPQVVSTSLATRATVQSAVAYPWASGPAFNARFTRCRSAGVSWGGRPARPARRRPLRPCSAMVLAQRLTDWRVTPSRRATSACGVSCRSKVAPARRRRSKASKSRLLRLCAILPSFHQQDSTTGDKCHSIYELSIIEGEWSRRSVLDRFLPPDMIDLLISTMIGAYEHG